MAKVIDGQTVYAINPYDCGCTECLVGEYVPLHRMDVDHLRAVVMGDLAWHVGYIASVDVSYRNYDIEVRFRVYNDVYRTLYVPYDSVFTSTKFSEFIVGIARRK